MTDAKMRMVLDRVTLGLIVLAMIVLMVIAHAMSAKHEVKRELKKMDGPVASGTYHIKKD